RGHDRDRLRRPNGARRGRVRCGRGGRDPLPALLAHQRKVRERVGKFVGSFAVRTVEPDHAGLVWAPGPTCAILPDRAGAGEGASRGRWRHRERVAGTTGITGPRVTDARTVCSTASRFYRVGAPP